MGKVKSSTITEAVVAVLIITIIFSFTGRIIINSIYGFSYRELNQNLRNQKINYRYIEDRSSHLELLDSIKNENVAVELNGNRIEIKSENNEYFIQK
ncbi:hypothetical protein [Mangrovivirga cuniculi]|uniref:Uncharacterized protein n=1 Tax=Mangrovivirga cuniculi TaxID=2715131 RepID=A0A4D7JF50_9BACT|nr:hypothetical protein [Mangrovivirga cuniculi]QCK13763.1 hypothetical protein DCC35_02820 [Mangrovivirga cuniculi]